MRNSANYMEKNAETATQAEDGRVIFAPKPRACSGCGGDVFGPLLRNEPADDVEYFNVSYTKWNSLDTGEKRMLIKEVYNDKL